MPTTQSQPSQEELTGLRNEGHWDPLLPSSPEEEQLTPIITSGILNKRPAGAHQGDPVQTPQGHQGDGMDATAYDNFDFSTAYLEDAPFLNDGSFFRTNTGLTLEEPMSATSLTNKSLQTTSRKSTGIATMSSQLMSPALTDLASPKSTGGDSPIVHHRVLGGGFLEDFSSDGTMGYSNETPDVSKSSTNTSLKSQKQSSGTTSNIAQASKKRRVSEPIIQDDEEDFEMEDTATTVQSRHGVNPDSRITMKNATVMNLKEQTTKKAVDAKNRDISNWLSTSELTPADHDHLSAVNTGAKTRRRSKSTGDKIIVPPQYQNKEQIMEEHSEDEGNDSDLGSYHDEAPVNFARKPSPQTTVNIQLPSPDEDPRPQDASPWVDPIQFPSEEGHVGQPATSNEAMMKFLTRARDIETSSRVATWGTQRRMSDGDTSTWSRGDHEMQRIFGHGGLLSRLSLTKEKEEEYREEWKHFKEHAKEKAARWFPKRDSFYKNDPVRTTTKDSATSATSPTPSIKSKRESTHDLTESIRARLHRHSSAPKKPDLNTHTNTDTGNTSPHESHSPTHSITAIAHDLRGRLSRHGSKDEGGYLASLWKTQSGGPPVPYPKTSQSPANKSETQFRPPPATVTHVEYTQVVAEPTPITTSFHDGQLPIPTLEGFKIDARRKLPNLFPYLVDRLALEQLRRYKKLVEFKVKHAQAVANGSCTSGKQCTAGLGEIVYFPTKAQKEPMSSRIGVNMAGDDDDDEILDENIVTEASFPPGVPGIPAKKLPAQFECPLCFQVKKFTKPSDWSKHVHEDLQPFTCTFSECSEPKSFKRKADWVRHENERHRHLEWWQCSEEGCNHQCFRRDNFVQHLCREHKMPEPKAKTNKPDNKPAVRGPAKMKGKGNIELTPDNQLLWMVDTCRHETPKRANEEPCRLCGRSFNTWKKLTVDLAKHMEELSLPLLELVNLKSVTSETIVSPIEAKPSQFNIGQSPYTTSASVSPYDQPINDNSVVMTDLPGAFAPLHGTNTFQQPQFGNVAWNTGAGQASTMFPDLWPPAANGDVQFGNTNHLFSDGAAHGQSAANGGYDNTPSSVAQGMSMHYSDGTGMMTNLDVSPGFPSQQFSSISTIQSSGHHSPPIVTGGFAAPPMMNQGTYQQSQSQSQQGAIMFPSEHLQLQQQQQQQQQHQPYFSGTY